MDGISAEWESLLRLVPGYDPFRATGGAWFDPEAAQLALDFFPECVRHVEGEKAGQPFVLEPWQRAVVANLFGWKRKDLLGRTVRRYREALIYVPRKNGKTPWMAGLALFVLFADDEAGQQNYIAAESREQAGKLFRHAKGMVAREPELASRCRVYGGTAAAGQAKSIVKRDDETSFLQVISADADSQHGGNSHLVIVDELHAQPDRELIDVLTTSTASLNRKQTLVIYITTADFQRESICNEKHAYACKVRDGLIDDPAFLPVVYEAALDADWTAPETWRKANPNLGVSVSEEYLARECKKAQENPALENTFRRLNLNQKTEQDVRWLPMDQWARCGQHFDPATLDGRDCWAGLDFGWRDDYAALVLVWNVEGVFYCLPWFWLSREGSRDKRQQPTAEFLARGLVTLTDGNATDIEAIYAKLRELRERYNIREVALDPANARKQGQDLMADGFEVFEFIQSRRSYTEPCRFLEALLRDGKLRHGGNRVLAWMASNAVAELDGLGQIMPKKKKSSEKIDGLVALVMGLGRAMMHADDTSVYEGRGILTL